jgi:hypothetical protein
MLDLPGSLSVKPASGRGERDLKVEGAGLGQPISSRRAAHRPLACTVARHQHERRPPGELSLPGAIGREAICSPVTAPRILGDHTATRTRTANRRSASVITLNWRPSGQTSRHRWRQLPDDCLRPANPIRRSCRTRLGINQISHKLSINFFAHFMRPAGWWGINHLRRVVSADLNQEQCRRNRCGADKGRSSRRTSTAGGSGDPCGGDHGTRWHRAGAQCAGHTGATRR